MRKLMIVIAAFAATSAFAQQDFSKIEIKVQKVAGTVYMLTGAGGNIGVSSGDDGIVIVDDQFAPLAPKIREALHGITAKPIKFILNTHYHGDHTGGNAIFGHDGPIIAHENVRTRLAAGSTTRGNATPPAPKEALPVITGCVAGDAGERGQKVVHAEPRGRGERPCFSPRLRVSA